MPFHPTRRRLLGTAAAAATVTVLPPARSSRAAAKSLRVFAWEGYADAPFAKAFTERTGAALEITYAGSADEMFARTQGSDGRDFDLLALDTGSFKRYLDLGLLLPLDLAKLKNAGNLMQAFQGHPAVTVAGKSYATPFAWGSLPLIYDKAAFPTPPDSWGVLYDPANAQQIIALDDANNSIVCCALYLGAANPYALTEAEMAKVKATLIEQKRLLLTYFAGFDEGAKIFAENDIKAMFSMGEPQLGQIRAKGVDAALVIPKEGAVGWLDCWTMTKGCRDPELAAAWIDLMLEKQTGAYLGEKHNYGNTTNADANGVAGLTYADKLSFLQTPESYEKRTILWNEVKAA